MIKIIIKEYVDKNNIANKEITIKFIGMIVYKLIRTTTNINIINNLKIYNNEECKIKGFKRYEDENKNKSTD